MRYGLVVIPLIAFTVVAASNLSDTASRNVSAQEGASEEEVKPVETSSADNSVCYVCHLNYEEERLVMSHAREGIGCTDCHGESWDHADDEGNEIPPDIMFPLEKIDQACRECHETHDVTAKRVLSRWQKRCSHKKDPQTIVCTDCHGRHRLDSRTVRWNRTTGELILEDEAPIGSDE